MPIGKQVPLHDFVRENYEEYGKYVALQRVVPRIDGLKPSHRRILLTLMELAAGKLTGTLNAIGRIQVRHPFGNQSIENTVGDMGRIGAIDSEGSFGIRLIERILAAAPRYTKVGLTKEMVDYYFRFLDYSNEVDGEEMVEPEFLITPVPYALIYGDFIWGFGIQSRIPAFTYESLLEAHRADDPTLLQSNYGYKIDRSKSDLKELWETGAGRLTLNLKVTRPSDDTVVIRGSGEVFIPALGLFDEYIEDGRIEVIDASSSEVEIVIRKVKRNVDMKDIYDIAKRVSSKGRGYSCQIVNNGMVRQISIREWLQVTMGLYSQVYERARADKIVKKKFDRKVYEVLPKLGQRVLDGEENDTIATALNVDLEVVKAGVGKSIGMLRKSDHSARIDSIDEEIKAIKALEIQSDLDSFKSIW